MSLIARGAVLLALASVISLSGPLVLAADIPAWMRGELIKKCRAEVPGQFSPAEADRYCKCFIRELAANLTNDDLVEMSNGTMGKAATGRMLEAAGFCLQEN